MANARCAGCWTARQQAAWAEITEKRPSRELGAGLTTWWKVAVSFQSTSEAGEKGIKKIGNSTVFIPLWEKMSKKPQLLYLKKQNGYMASLKHRGGWWRMWNCLELRKRWTELPKKFTTRTISFLSLMSILSFPGALWHSWGENRSRAKVS